MDKEKENKDKDKKKKPHSVIGGIITGLINGLLGAGGGMIAIPFLSRVTEPKKAHATCVAIILPMCVSSAISYMSSSKVTLSDVAPYVIWGVIGALIGTVLLSKLSNVFIKKLFAVFMLWAAARLIFR